MAEVDIKNKTMKKNEFIAVMNTLKSVIFSYKQAKVIHHTKIVKYLN